jgi:hypothetical protein
MAPFQRRGKAWGDHQTALAEMCEKAIAGSHAVVFISYPIGRVVEDILADRL